MILGAAIGIPLNRLAADGTVEPATVHEIADGAKAIGDLFLKLLKMVVVPLIVSSLITGVTGLGKPSELGKMGARTFGYYLGTSLLAIVTGLVMVNLFSPGVGANLESLVAAGGDPEVPEAVEEGKGLGTVLWEQLESMIPENPFAAGASEAPIPMLAIIFFSLLFGFFITATGGPSAARLKELFAAVFEVMMKMTLFIILLAPIGVLAFMLHATAAAGIDVFVTFGKYMITVICALGFHAFVTLPLLLWFVARRSPLEFVRAMTPALLTAFSTASSNATLPLTMENVEHRGGVPNRVSSFVLPLGATVNMDGTALYEAVAVLFIAQVYGHDLTIAQQIVVAFTALLASVGAAGIPHAGLVMMVVVLEAVGLPTSAVALILAVDRVLDMCRTTVNVWSDSTAAAVVARYSED